MMKRIASLPLLMVATQAGASAQSISWTLVASNGPVGLMQHAMAYDNWRGTTVLFGGQEIGGAVLGETWEWNGQAWSQSASGGPAPRMEHAMAFDGARGRVVLFGGSDGAVSLGDTWEWDGQAWLPQLFASGPVARRDHAMAYDSARHKTILFGGWVSAGVYLGDTWEWDGFAWTPAAGGPPARAGHAMAYDSQRSRSVLFGGYGSSAPSLGDTWEYDGTAWTLSTASGPAPRASHAMAYDSLRGYSIVFAGWGSSGWLGGQYSYDGTGWHILAAPGAPGPITEHAMAYDSQRGMTVLFGGGVSGYPCQRNTFELGGGTVSTASAFGSGCGNPVLDLTPAPNSRPSVGTTAQVAVAGIPTNLCWVSLGWSRNSLGAFTLPLTLTGFGMPGCELLQSADAMPLSTFVGAGAATYSLALPSWSGLIGLHLYLQAVASAPGTNAGGLIVSNGVEWVIGNS